MPWESLSTDDVLALFNDSETDAYNVAKGDTTGADLATILCAVVDELREAIASRGIPLGPDGTIPSGHKKRAIGAVRYEFLNAIPAGKKLLTDTRVAANTAFEKLIAGIQDGSIKVTPGDGSSAMVLPATDPRHRQMTLRKQQGL